MSIAGIENDTLNQDKFNEIEKMTTMQYSMFLHTMKILNGQTLTLRLKIYVLRLVGLWCLTPLSTIFQLYRGSHDSVLLV